MKADIAVATVNGKAYYLIVQELRKRNIPFLSLKPEETIPAEVKAVITTEGERHLINHQKVIVYNHKIRLESLVNEATRAAQGKDRYERIVIGIDPGKVIGLAILADGKVIETANCFSISETLARTMTILRDFEHVPIESFTVRVGDGAPEYKEELLRKLDQALSPNISLESVGEAGTSTFANESAHRRGLRDIVSAIKIAGRNGHRFERGKSK